MIGVSPIPRTIRNLQPRTSAPVLLTIAVGGTFLWSYWPSLSAMAERWWHDPQYSHGFLVPVFALYLLWHRRGQRPAFHIRPVGVLLLVAASACRLVGVYFYLNWLDGASLLLGLVGIAVLFGGWKAAVWASPAIGFLVFMIPLPFRFEVALAHPLQRLATLASSSTLLILGFPAISEGNIITINQSKIGVAQACSGLSMLMTFFALTVAFVLVRKRPWPDRLLIVASAVPIAILANIARITTTGVLFETVGTEAGRAFFHDLAGWFMIVLALGMLWLEFWVLGHLFLETEAGQEAPLSLRTS